MNFYRLTTTMRGGNLQQIYVRMAKYMLIAACALMLPAGQWLCAQNFMVPQASDAQNRLDSDALPPIDADSPNFLRMESQQTPSNGTADYLDEVLFFTGGRVFRFTSMPITVHINEFPDKHFMSCVERGLLAWQSASQATVQFQFVDDPAKARIVIAWKHLGLAEDSSGCTLGAHTITKLSAENNGGTARFMVNGVPVSVSSPDAQPIVAPQIIELNLDLIMRKQPNARLRLIQNVVTHECGHALGLLGHSPNLTDMMYAVTDEHSRLSQQDIRTLVKLYQKKADVGL